MVGTTKNKTLKLAMTYLDLEAKEVGAGDSDFTDVEIEEFQSKTENKVKFKS